MVVTVVGFVALTCVVVTVRGTIAAYGVPAISFEHVDINISDAAIISAITFSHYSRVAEAGG